jgi:hypothetical protein
MSTDDSSRLPQGPGASEDQRSRTRQHQSEKFDELLERQVRAALPVRGKVGDLRRAPYREQFTFRVFLGSRLLGSSLDERLAKGESPASSELLAARAQLIVSAGRRLELAERWLSLIDLVNERPHPYMVSSVAPVRQRIIDNTSKIRAMAGALMSPLPTSRGVAMARTLLSDGAGPVYYRGSSASLEASLRRTILHLDPLYVG